MAEAIIPQAGSANNCADSPVPFAFESHQIRTVVNGDGNPWFVAKDVCAVLTIPWRGETLRSIPADWKGMRKLRTPNEGVVCHTTPRVKDGKISHGSESMGEETPHTSNGRRGGWRPNTKITVINEPAVYKLAFRSNKPEADRFTNWIASEVIPALRRTGRYEVCPPAPTPSSARLTTAKERNALTGLVNRYVGLLPGGPHQEAYKAAWRKVHDVMGIGSLEELTVEQLPRAVLFVKSLVDATGLPESEPAKSLPPARRRNTLDDYKAMYRELPDSPQHWLRLITETFHATEAFGKKLEAIKAEATKPFRSGRTSDVSTYFDASMSPMFDLFSIADEQLRLTYRCVYHALEGCRNTWLLLNKG